MKGRGVALELQRILENDRYKIYGQYSSEQIVYLERVTQRILDRNYDLLYDFFCNVLERPEEYKVLRARRCQVLFRVFLPIVLKNEPDIQIHGTFISSHAISKYREHLQKSSVLILDDIVIHGGGLQELYEKLDKNYENDNLHIYVHRMARSADAMKNQLKRKITFDSRVFDWEWRELSTQLVNVIQATVTSYVSYVESYASLQYMEEEQLKGIFSIQENTNDDQKRVQTKAFVLYENEEFPKIIRNGGYDACVRYYENRNMNKVIYMPYVFMKVLSDDDIDRFGTACEACFGERYNCLKQELLVRQKDDLSLQYRACLVNVLLNRIYGLYLDHKYQNVFDFSCAEWVTLTLCFGEKVAEEIERLTYEDVCGLLDVEFCETCYGTNEETDADSELTNGLKQALKCTEEEKRLPLYFYFSRQLDEEKIRKRQMRKKGLPLQVFYDEITDVHKASKMQLKCWDAGWASCDVGLIGSELISAYVRAGEQSFRYIIDEMKERRGKHEKAAKYDGEEQGLDGKMWKQFLKDNSECLGEWDIPEIYC